ncbi:unnamed protein product [Gulo gulo]|uniref:Uncharacterized protein n=1 Tax=Gulo gulo TaxID=48420 RepID=A0A9X9LMR4_GULGU|nr:unnamed protein product [Gulo gulo]
MGRNPLWGCIWGEGAGLKVPQLGGQHQSDGCFGHQIDHLQREHHQRAQPFPHHPPRRGAGQGGETPRTEQNRNLKKKKERKEKKRKHPKQ